MARLAVPPSVPRFVHAPRYSAARITPPVTVVPQMRPRRLTAATSAFESVMAPRSVTEYHGVCAGACTPEKSSSAARAARVWPLRGLCM